MSWAISTAECGKNTIQFFLLYTWIICLMIILMHSIVNERKQSAGRPTEFRVSHEFYWMDGFTIHNSQFMCAHVIIWELHGSHKYKSDPIRSPKIFFFKFFVKSKRFWIFLSDLSYPTRIPTRSEFLGFKIGSNSMNSDQIKLQIYSTIFELFVYTSNSCKCAENFT